MTTLDTTGEALLAAIRATPGEDLPRLVYADWLDERAQEMECDVCKGAKGRRNPSGGYQEFSGSYPTWGTCSRCSGAGRVSNGFAERAEFVRLQCQLAHLLRDIPEHLHDSLDMITDPQLKADQDWKREVLALQKRGQDFINRFDHSRVQFRPAANLRWRRGFIASAEAPLQACLDHLPRLVRHPHAVIESVRVTDREPSAGEQYPGFQWWTPPDRRRQNEPHDIVDDRLIALMRDDPRNTAPKGDRFVCFCTRKLALAALSDSLLRLGWSAQPAGGAA